MIKDEQLIKSRCTKENYEKLSALKNAGVFSFIAEHVRLCNPKSIFVKTDSTLDAKYIRKKAVDDREERSLKIENHRVHFDGFFDQARDKQATKYLLPEDLELGKNLNSISRRQGIKEIKELLKDSMRSKEMIVCFFGLGPLNSESFIPCVQITDSFYVAHSEDILYRSAYGVFKSSDIKEFFRFVHTAGELKDNVSKNVDRRRVYIDIKENTVFSTNTQYAGNAVGLKKLALRLAIRKAHKEKWLAEHMFVMGVHGPKNRVTYFCGAYPSACGKTSTAMIKGETIVGDDIAYLRRIDNHIRAVNVECGIFGIIKDVSEKSEPIIWKALTTKGEAIFSNVLVDDKGMPRWLGDERATPVKGVNFSGQWHSGKIDSVGNEVPYAHKNARYTISLRRLKNCDSNLDNPKGVKVGAMVYGGRDSDTCPPLQQSFSWEHGVITMGASLESETTAATLGKEGVRTFNLMSNLDFLSIPIGDYIEAHLDFVKGLENIPLIFGVNYFLRDENGAYLSGIEDKKVWFKWMELRVHNEVDVRWTPTGFIPRYSDLRNLFNKYLNKDYTSEQYIKQFTIRTLKNIQKIDRILNIYKKSINICSKTLFKAFSEQRNRLNDLMKEYGEAVDPFKLDEYRGGGK